MSKEIQIIENFIFNNNVQALLSQINDNIMDFNILEITGMGTQEIKHSNLLSWIFGDNEHELKYMIFEKFLHKVININGTREEIDILKHYLYLPQYDKEFIIYREKNDIDLLFVDTRNNIVIVIENKIYADERTEGEDGGQLKKYEKTIKEQYQDFKQIYIYLTISAQAPSADSSIWLISNYQMISDSIEETIATQQGLSDKTKIIFESYIDLLKRRGIVEDKQLKELCESIWKNQSYKEALLVLNQYQPDVNNLLMEIRQLLENEGINIYDYTSTKSDFAIFTKNYKTAYSQWKNYIKEDSDVELEIRFGLYIVKSNIQFWLILSDDPSQKSLQYFNKIKEKLHKKRSRKQIKIYAEDIIEDFDRFNIENTKNQIIEEFMKIIHIVDTCFE